MTEQEYRDKVYAEAKDVKTPEQLTAFLKTLTEYPHDYGTIVYACAAGMNAAFNVVNDSPHGGITGFQASCLMWEMVRKYGMFSNAGVLRIIDYSNLCYPQYDDKFTHKLTSEQRRGLMAYAKKQLAAAPEMMAPRVKERLEAVARGELPPFVTVSDMDE